MKIVDATLPRTKSDQMREAMRSIAGREQAAEFDNANDFRFFCKLARDEGYKCHSRKTENHGWRVWVFPNRPTNSH